MKTFTLPMKLESLANKREHHMATARRAKGQRQNAKFFCPPFEPPCRITITRVAPRALDSDNLAISGKHVRDGIADRLGVNDNDPRIEWRYAQEKGKPREYAVRIDLERTEET